MVLLAYDLDTGKRYTQVRQQRTKADYAQFMDHIISTYYTEVEAIDLVQDNLNTHTYGSFYEHLPLAQARLLSRKLVFHFTATADRPQTRLLAEHSRAGWPEPLSFRRWLVNG